MPIYSERNEQDKAFGAIVLSVATICVLGLGLVLGLFVLQDQVGSGANLDRETLSLLLVLIAIAPIDALDKLLQQVVAVYCSARAIFFRRQVVGPGLKLAAVLFVMAVTGDVYMLAYGYVLGSLIGVSLYLATLLRTWSRQGLLQYLRPGKYRLPFRELFGFSIPLLTTDLSVALRGALVVILLEYFRDASSVGEYRAVVSVAHLNTVVFEAFGFLFVPLASRMYARNDRQGIGDLYWATSLWIAVLTFPLFAATCVLSPTITVLLFGDRYAGAAVLLSVLAAGHYFNAALGFTPPPPSRKVSPSSRPTCRPSCCAWPRRRAGQAMAPWRRAHRVAGADPQQPFVHAGCGWGGRLFPEDRPCTSLITLATQGSRPATGSCCFLPG